MRRVMKNFCKILYLPALAFLIVGQLIQCMEPIKESRKYTFKWQKTEAMRRVLHTMITDLPAISKKPQDK